MKPLKIALIILGILFLVYCAVTPMIWSLLVNGVGATSDNGTQMQIHYVQPWPNKHLYAYRVSWKYPSESFKVDNTVFVIPERTAMGWCYVDECTVNP